MKYLYILLLFLTMLFIYPYCQNIEIENLIKKEINVTVTGEVIYPGDYSLETYSTLNDLLDICQLKENADLSVINPNLILKDNDYIVIVAKSSESKISINFATLQQLTTLPGIGTSKAQSIIDYRNENGLYQSLEEIMNVKGIGEKMFEKIKDLICL